MIKNSDSFKTRIKFLRETLGLNQTEFAQKLGISRTYVSLLEGGRKPSPSLVRLVRILENENGIVAPNPPPTADESGSNDKTLVSGLIEEIIEQSLTLRELEGGRRRVKIGILRELLEQLAVNTPQ